jgi:hypothetical protein
MNCWGRITLGFTQPILRIDSFCKRSLYFPTEKIKSTNLLHWFSLRGFSRDYCPNILVYV